MVNLHGMWIVAVYDQAKVNQRLGMHLSTNLRLYSYAETAEEGIVQTFRMMKINNETWRDCHVKTGSRSQSQQYKIRSLLQQDFIWKLMETIVDIPSTHYIHSDIFKISKLTQQLLSEHGGLLAALAISLEHRLQMCFNTVEWNASEVERHMRILDHNQASNQRTAEESRFYLNQCIEHLSLDKKPVKEAVNDKVRYELDTIYVNTLGKNDLWKFFGTPCGEWSDPYEEYAEAVVAKLDDILSEMTDDDLMDSLNGDVQRAWKDCSSKAKLVLQCRDINPIHEYLPFMSASVWDSMEQQLKRVPKTLLEISSWYSPLVYIHKIIGGTWKIGSPTADLVRAFYAHQDVRSIHLNDAFQATIWTLIQEFGSLLRMEEELLNANIPIRPDTSHSVKEYMLIEEDNKLITNIKVPKLLSNQATQTELRSEIVVFDNFAKDVIKSKWKPVVDKGWMERWTKTVQFNKEPTGFLRISTLLDFHTMQWGSTSGGSESRFRKETIAAAIVEYCTVYRYRLALLSNSDSGSTHIRSLLESVVSPMMSKNRGRPSAPDDELQGNKLTWPDRIDINTSRALKTNFDIQAENKRMSITVQKRKDVDDIKKVIHAIQSCPSALDPVDPDAMNKQRTIRSEIYPAVKTLAKFLSFSAYANREQDVELEHLINNTTSIPTDEDILLENLIVTHDDKEITHTLSLSTQCLFSGSDNDRVLKSRGFLVSSTGTDHAVRSESTLGPSVALESNPKTNSTHTSNTVTNTASSFDPPTNECTQSGSQSKTLSSQDSQSSIGNPFDTDFSQRFKVMGVGSGEDLVPTQLVHHQVDVPMHDDLIPPPSDPVPGPSIHADSSSSSSLIKHTDKNDSSANKKRSPMSPTSSVLVSPERAPSVTKRSRVTVAPRTTRSTSKSIAAMSKSEGKKKQTYLHASDVDDNDVDMDTDGCDDDDLDDLTMDSLSYA
ncbi:hypothetical protein JVU11DRAFT_12445 [Chiua virens]|nr:hypothetical protein JVU11DRAFT_12445 [Chiua virens]